MIRPLLCAGALVLGAAGGSAEPAAPPETIAAMLATVREQRTVQLTTIGRRSGKPHSVPVWFMVDGPVVYLNTLDTNRDWVLNAQKTPTVRLDFGGTVLTGELHPTSDPALDAKIRQALRDKYWVAWAGGLVGKGPKQTYVVDALRPATP